MNLKISKCISIMFLSVALTGQVFAEGRISVSEEIVLNAEVSVVWETIRDFGDLSWIFGDGAIIEVTGSPFDAGSMRAIQGPNGGSAREVLVAHNDDEKYYKYTYVIDNVSPLTNYLATLRVFSHVEGTTKVVWSSTFDVKDDVAASAMQTNIINAYRNGLSALKQHVE